MVSTFIGLLDIQSWWEIPCIAHFCSLFSSAFDLPDIDIEDLELALLTDGTEENSSASFLPDLIVSLLKGCNAVRREQITTSNYQMFLRRCLRRFCRENNIENYFDADTDFQSLPLRNKLLVLYCLCHLRLESKDVPRKFNNLEADSLRVEPLGYDSKNSSYWYFYGTRLYREDTKIDNSNEQQENNVLGTTSTSSSTAAAAVATSALGNVKGNQNNNNNNKKTVWQVVCFTEEDWQNLTSKFKNSTSEKERALYNILTENFLPKLPELFREKEKLRRRKLLQIRTSARIRNLTEEKQKLAEKEKLKEAEQQEKLEEKLKLEEIRKKPTRTRRRSQSVSTTASGISTYASSLRGSSSSTATNSSDFLCQREKFCLSPDLVETTSNSDASEEDSSEISDKRLFNDEFNNSQILEEDLYVLDPTVEANEAFRKRRTTSLRKSSASSSSSSISKGSDSPPLQEHTEENLINYPEIEVDQENKENHCHPLCPATETECRTPLKSNLKRKSKSATTAIRLEMAPTTNIKVTGRQTNNSLSSLTGNIFIPDTVGAKNVSSKPAGGGGSTNSTNNTAKSSQKPSSTETAITKSKKSKNSESFTENDEVLQIGMHKVLVYVKNHRDAWPFMDPVEEDIAPRYYSIIRRPMDLLKMEEKLDNGEYTKFSEFRNDFKLIVNNCRLYNGQNNEYTEMVNNLQEAFDKATKKYFDQISSEEEGTISYPDSKINNIREKYFNKTSTPKSIQKEISKKTLSTTTNKDKEKRDKYSVGNNKSDESKSEEVSLNIDETSKSNKRKRKDKDKRRKKKSKTKHSACSADLMETEEDQKYESNGSVSDDLNENGEDNKNTKDRMEKDLHSDSESIETDDQIINKPKKKPAAAGKNELESTPVNKKGKNKHSNTDMKEVIKELKEEENEENEVEEETTKKKPKNSVKRNIPKDDRKRNKHGRVHKNVKSKKPENTVDEGTITENENETKNADKKLSSDDESTSNPLTATAGEDKTQQKSNSSQEQQGSNKTKNKNRSTYDNKKSTNLSKTNNNNNNNNNNTNNSNSNSKLAKENQISSSETITETEKPKDRKAKNSSNPSKRKVNKVKKSKKMDVNESQGKVNESDDDDSLSLSSSPVFKVDLHKKYAKSASSHDEDINENFNNSHTKTKLANNSSSRNRSTINKHKEDLTSISSRSLSRSPPPSAHPNKNDPNPKEKKDSTSPKSKNEVNSLEERQESSTDQIPLFMDKYDLIKQRRNRNTEEKWNQIVKEAEKLKSNTKKRPATKHSTDQSKEKNQKLRETIEKLKEKNAKSKEQSVLIDEIFGVKPAQEIRDEKTIFEKIRETCLDSKSSPSHGKKSNESLKRSHNQENNSSDKSTPPKKIKKKENKQEKNSSASGSGGTFKKSSKKHSNNLKKNSSKTNMEALELETEQTLKDINRWLEHTPRFSEFSSASNSPSHYNLLDDFDAVTSKLDPNDFRRPVPITLPKSEIVPKLTETLETLTDNSKKDVIPDLISSANNPLPNEPSTPKTASPPNTLQSKNKESTVPSTIQLLPHPPPPPPHIKSQQQKENKRKSLKEKLTGVTRRKDVLRTIERLQPGKTKGNLISNMHNVNKPDELFPIGPVAKTKEVKNSLVVETDETAPKLSLGSVLNTEGFGLGQLHNFKDDIASGDLKMSENVSSSEEPSDEKKEEIAALGDVEIKSAVSNPKKEEKETKEEIKNEKSSATPNLSAWFKAFGAPKKAKKLGEEEKKVESIDSVKISSPTEEKSNGEQQQQQQSVGSTFNTILKSPQGSSESFPLPAPRQRKASTGSTISERSSFSQDPDSPRIGIDDRFGAYSGPYASPIGASPIMVSPKPEDIGKPTSPYPLNGTIKVGFYQDTTTKSSPEKSCSPRELPSPYPQYSQHIYSTSTSSTTVTANDGTTSTFGNCYNAPTEANKSILYSNTSPTPLYDQYKQPKSQESDYNSSMSPNTNPNSPYQQPKNSPYQQHPNSPYQQAQTSPYQQQPNSPYQQPQNSPYQQPQSSPYQQPQNSPYQQQQTSPYQSSSAGNMQNVLPTQAPTSPIQQSQITSRGPLQQQHQSDPTESKTSSYSSQPDNNPAHQQPTNLVYGNQNTSSSYPQESSVLTMPTVRPLQQQQPPQYSIPENGSYQPATSNSSNLLSNQQQSKWSNPTPSRENEQRSENPQIQSHPVQRQSIITEDDSISNKQKVNTSYPEAQQHYPPPIFNTPFNKTSLTALSPVNFTPDMTKRSSENEQTQLMDLGGYTNQQNSKNLPKGVEEKSCDFTVNKQQQMFDSFLGSMGTNKSHLVGFGKSMDISTSKAFEMFNRAATMGFSKEFPTNLISNAKQVESANNSSSIQQNTSTNTTCNYSAQPPQQISQNPYPVVSKQLNNNNSILNSNQRNNKPINMINNPHSQSAQQQLQSVSAHSQHYPPEQHDTGKLPSYQQDVHSNLTENKHHSHHPSQESASLYNPKLTSQSQPNPYTTSSDQPTSVDKMSHEMPISLSSNSNRTAQSYKPSPYNNSPSLLDPLRSLNHPLSTMMDDAIIDMQNPSSTYYEKNIPPAHMFSKNLGHHQQMYQNHLSSYTSRDQQNPLSAPIVPYGGPAPTPTGAVPPSVAPNPEVIEPKPAKRTRRKKNATAASLVTETMSQQQQLHQQQHHHQQQLSQNTNNGNILSSQSSAGVVIPASASQIVDLQSSSQLHQNSHSHHIQNQAAANHQGFQLYAGIKTAAVVAAGNSSTVTPPSTTVDSSAAAAISLKTNMVPGSAFNFGPSPTAPLGLSTGIYPENSNYLDEYRAAPNPYYIPPTGHSRSGGDGKVESQVNTGGPPPSSTSPYHQFLTHTPSRGSYPFMNSPQLDPSSPIYQQYLQRQDELRARMMLNQGLLGAPGTAAGYPQPSYRPTLGMPKPYDMNRQPWF